MRLYQICDEAEAAGIPDTGVNGVTDNSKDFKAGDIFVCIKGESFDGHSVAAEMAEKGASAVVTAWDLGLDNQIIVPDTRKVYAKLASNYYKNPTTQMKLVGATGTNGKSTVIALIKHILEKSGFKTGSIGTVGYDVVGKIYDAELTTPRQMDLYKYFREMADNGAKYCVVEASSQGLSQNRFANETFSCAVFTNLSQDHLDWHKSMEKYYIAKRSLFDMAKKAVVCVDEKYGRKLEKYINDELKIPLITCSAEDVADCYAVNIKTSNSGISYWLSSMAEEKSFPVKLALPGLYNVANSISAISACSLLGIPLEYSVEALKDFQGVKGRCEVIYDGEFTVIRDYAHTDDALTKFLTDVRGFAKKRVICVFGAAGERDATKRPLMGEAVAKLSDYIFVTSDNPRFEEPELIISQVAEGIKNTPYEIFVDRKEAIEAALKMAEKDDVIVLCGKGHETYQVIKDEYQPFDEKEIVRKAVGA